MRLNETLQRDINNLTPEANKRLRPDADREVFTDITIGELKETFAIYGVEYNEETLKAAAATLIWSTSASQQMFIHRTPDHIEQSPLSYAIHGGLVAMNTVFTALRKVL